VTRFTEMFGADGRKPIIAMAHIPALPGTPLYDEAAGVDGILRSVESDLAVLLAHPFDAVLFCNEGDRPYALKVGYESVAVMSRVVTRLSPSDRPFGVDFLWDAQAAMAVASATGASFIREVVTGVYESDMGLWSPDPAALLRYRRQLHADHVARIGSSANATSPGSPRRCFGRGRAPLRFSSLVLVGVTTTRER